MPPPTLLQFRDQFISAEINHDFNAGKGGKPDLNEYQGDCWATDTICTAANIINYQRRKGADGDDDLCYQIFGRYKSGLKLLPNGVPTVIGAQVSQLTGYTLSNPIAQPAPGAPPPSLWRDAIHDPNVVITKFEVVKSGPASKNLEMYKILTYPNENFFIIDAVPQKIIRFLKEIQFPPVPDYTNGNTYLGAIPTLPTGFDPNSYENFTIDMLNTLANFSLPPASATVPLPGGLPIQCWPFRPKINIIHSPNTVGDASTLTNFPGSLDFQSSKSFQQWLPNWNAITNSSELPGIPVVENASKPFIFSWYYNISEVSAANNPLMMSKFKIKTSLNTPFTAAAIQAAPGVALPADATNAGNIGKFFMEQVWTGYPDTGPGKYLYDASAKNNPRNLKTEIKPRTAATAVPPTPTSCPPSTTPKHCDIVVNPANFQLASQCVQRKRSGDYLQIKTALEFSRNAQIYGNNTTIYKIMQAHPNAIGVGPYPLIPRLSGNGHLKATPRQAYPAPPPPAPPGAPPWSNVNLPDGNTTSYYKNRTYFVTGDWPAFLYCVFNKINCLIYCDGACRGASGTPDLIFRAYFP